LAQQRKRLEAIKAPPEPEEAPPSKSRQIEIGVGLLGALGGAAVLLLLILAPQSVDEMNALEPYLAVAIGLGALLAPRPDAAVVAFRIGSCAALASLVVLLHPVQLSKFTFERRLRSGAQVEDAVAQLARLGTRNYAAASLSGAKLSGLDLASADFSGADLSNANFDQGFLLESDFRGANVNGARFTGANLWGALLSDGGGWSEALCDSYTVMPIGWYCAKGTFAFDPTATEGESEENIEDNAPSPASSAAQKQGSADQVFGRPH
jgi:hypothetical protein